MSKVCFKCGEMKAIDDFYRHPGMSDGRLNKCKECTRADVRNNRLRRRAYYNEYDRRRFQDNPKRRAETIERSLSYKDRSPQKYRAHYAVSNAVRDGRLHKPDICERCQCPPAIRLEAHHHDYNKPLDVAWLCTDCHSEAHQLAEF